MTKYNNAHYTKMFNTLITVQSQFLWLFRKMSESILLWKLASVYISTLLLFEFILIETRRNDFFFLFQQSLNFTLVNLETRGVR